MYFGDTSKGTELWSWVSNSAMRFHRNRPEDGVKFSTAPTQGRRKDAHRQTHTHTDTQTHTQTHRQTHTHTHTHTQIDTQTPRHTDRHTDRLL